MLALTPPTFHAGRAFLSPDSALGFGVGDWAEFFVSALLVGLILLQTRWRSFAEQLARCTKLCMVALAIIPVTLRLFLLRTSPIPTPTGADDFGYILLADTLRHLRFANPSHALPQFFEQVFVLQQPTYSSMYPLGQGLLLAFGWVVFGQLWAGVLLSVAALCALSYWMLRAWISPVWALAGGFFAIALFGPLSYWTNGYRGGPLSAIAGCLVFGALPRLRENLRLRDAALLGLGLSIQLLTRPYEFVFLLLSTLLYWLPDFKLFLRLHLNARVLRVALCSAAVLSCASAVMLIQDKQVTGEWTKLPYVLYRYQYGVPTTFTFQANPVAHRLMTKEQDLDYRAERAVHGAGTDTPRLYFQRLLFRLRFLRFFFLPPLYLALLAFITTVRNYRSAWIVFTMLLFLLGSNFFPYFYPHYIAAISCLFLLASVLGLERLNRLQLFGRSTTLAVGNLLGLLCAAHFVVWYGVHAIGSELVLSEIGQYESWDYVNRGDQLGQIRINNQLAAFPGKQLVFVHYAPGHMFQEWIHNAANIDSSHVVFANDLGLAENTQLLRYYPDRRPWLLEPDAAPPRLVPYASEPIQPKASPFEDVR